MSCPSPLTHSMYADGALAPTKADAVAQHLGGCAACRARIAALRREREVLRAALQATEDSAPIPAFEPPLGAHWLAATILGSIATAAFVSGFWSATAAVVPSGLRWLNPFATGELLERALNFTIFVIYEGTAMWSNTINFVGAALVLALLGWAAITAGRRHAGTAVLLSLLVAAVALPSLGHALEIRRDTLITLARGEVVHDTLIAAGETVEIDGDVDGDLLAFGRSVTVRGNVSGDLLTAGETVNVEGTVGGNVIGFGRSLTLDGTRVSRNVYGFGRDIELATDSEVGANLVAFGDNIDVDGRVGIDLKGFGNRVTVAGNVQGNVEIFAADTTLLPSARVSGNVTAHVDDTENLKIATGAVIGGNVDRQLVEREQRRNAYLTMGFYVRQVVRLGAAFVTGLLLLWVFPPLRTLQLPNGMAALRAGGIGLMTAATLPIAAVLACITIVGLPIGIATFVLGAIALYFAKTVLAQVIGAALFRSPAGPPHYAATLLAGLMVVVIAINLPFVGGIANFVLTLVGLGLIVGELMKRFRFVSAR